MKVTSRFRHRGRGEGLNLGEVQKQDQFCEKKEEREKRGWKGKGQRRESQRRIRGGKWWVGHLPNDSATDEIESGALAPN